MRQCLLLASVFTLLGSAAYPATTPLQPAPAPIGPSVYSAPLVREFLAACGRDENACQNEVGIALMNKMDYSGTSKVCIQSPDYTNAVPTWLNAHPEAADMPTEDGIYLAIKALYPCA